MNPGDATPETITAFGGIIASVIAGVVSIVISIVQARSAGKKAGKEAGKEAGGDAVAHGIDNSDVIVDLATKVSNLGNESREQRRLIDDQAGKLDHLTVVTLERDEAVSKNRIANMRIEELNRKIGQLNAELLTLRSRHGEETVQYEEKIAELERERDQLKKLVDDLERRRGEVNERIAELEHECDELRKRLSAESEQ